MVEEGDNNKALLHEGVADKIQNHIEDWPETVATFKAHFSEFNDLWEKDEMDGKGDREVKNWQVNKFGVNQQAEYDSNGILDGRSISISGSEGDIDVLRYKAGKRVGKGINFQPNGRKLINVFMNGTRYAYELFDI